MNFRSIWQWVVVKPNTRYRFNAYVRSADLTTDSGVFFQIVDGSHSTNSGQFKTDPVITPNMIAQPWTSGLNSSPGRRRNFWRSFCDEIPIGRLDNKISGTAWVDDVSLTPSPAAALNENDPNRDLHVAGFRHICPWSRGPGRRRSALKWAQLFCWFGGVLWVGGRRRRVPVGGFCQPSPACGSTPVVHNTFSPAFHRTFSRPD